MFHLHSTGQFLRQFNAFRVLSRNYAVGCEKTSFKSVHSLYESKQKRPIRQNSKRMKRPVKLADKKDAEPKIFMRDKIRNISNMLRNSTWDSAQEQLENLSIKWDSYTINQVLKTHPPLQKAWLFFDWADRLKGFKHDQYTYTTMLDIFGEAKRISSMKHLFKKMKGKEIRIDVVTYTSLMHWLSNDGDIEGAMLMWQEMKDTGIYPTVVSYTAYMKILFDHNRVKAASKVYKEMLQSGCSPNCHTYTVLMVHLANCGKFSELMEIFNKMQEAGVQPDKATCNILVEICSKSGEICTVTKILQYMKENSLVLRYPIFMEALESFRIAGKSDLLLKQVSPHISIINEKDKSALIPSSKDISPTVEQELILHMLAKRNFVAVDYLLSEIKDKNLRLDSDTISRIIEVCGTHEKSNSALLAYDCSVKMGINFGRTSYLTLIGIFIRSNKFPKILEIIEEMFKAGFSLGSHLSALLLHKLGRARKLGPAIKIFDLLPDDEKNTATYTAIIGSYLFCGKVEEGISMFNEMKEKEISIALSTFNVLLKGLEKNNRPNETEFYKKEMKRLQVSVLSKRSATMEEDICNLLFGLN